MVIGVSAKRRIRELAVQQDINVGLSEALNAFLEEGVLGCDWETFRDDCTSLGVTGGEYYAKRMLLELGLSEKEADDLLSQNLLKVKELDPASYVADPFVSRLGKAHLQRGTYSLSSQVFQPLEGFLLTDVESGSAKENYATRTTLGYFSKGYHFPILTKGKRIWMSGSPYEIETMRAPLGKAHGRVLTLGLGLGYFACSALFKDGVTSVTAVENAPEVIEIFKKGIEPHMGLTKELEIVQSDAFDYLEAHGAEYDYIFADLWHDEIDGLPMYAHLLQIARKNGLSLDFWIEPTILTYLRECTIQTLSLMADGEKPLAVDGPVVAALYRYLQDSELEDGKAVDDLLTDEALRRIASEIRP